MIYKNLYLLFAVMSSLSVATYAATESKEVKYFTIAPDDGFFTKFKADSESLHHMSGGLGEKKIDPHKVFKDFLHTGSQPADTPDMQSCIQALSLIETDEEQALLELKDGVWTLKPFGLFILPKVLDWSGTTILLDSKEAEWKHGSLLKLTDEMLTYDRTFESLFSEINGIDNKLLRRMETRLAACHLLSSIGQRNRAAVEWVDPSV